MVQVLETMPEVDEEESLLETGSDIYSTIHKLTVQNQDADDDANSDRLSTDSETLNMFDSLCCGLMSSLQLVHSALDDLMNLKDELLKHSLPPILLSKIVICTSKVFRSMSECRVPADELVRMVHLYSESWEQKSVALKKLHDGYSSMRLQLDIALRKLSLNDAKVKYAEKQKQLTNWERLFWRTVIAKKLGNKYEDLVGYLRQKSLEGVESVKDLVLRMNDLPTDKRQEQNSVPVLEHPPETTDDNLLEARNDEFMISDSISVISTSDTSIPPVSENNETDLLVAATVHRPVMCDVQVSTEDPDYDVYLYVRVHAPEVTDDQSVKCILTLADQRIETDIFHPASQNVSEIRQEKARRTSTTDLEIPDESETKYLKVGRDLSPTGSIGRKSTVSKNPNSEAMTEHLFDDCVFRVGEEMSNKVELNVGMQFHLVVYSVDSGRPLGITNVELADLQKMDLSSFILPTLYADSDSVSDISCLTDSPRDIKSSFVDSNWPHNFLCSQMCTVKPVNYDLHTAQLADDEHVDEPVGSVNLSYCWIRRHQPRTFNRLIQAESLSEIIFNGAAADQTMQSPAGSQPHTLERSVSAMSNSNDLMPKSEYLKVMLHHEEEIEILKAEYESRLHDLTEAVQMMQESQNSNQLQRYPASHWIRERNTASPRRLAAGRSRSCLEPIMEPEPTTILRSKSNDMHHDSALPTDIPKNFFDRLQHFEERVKRHRQELYNQSREQESTAIERRLATECKLDRTEALGSDGIDQNALQDVSLPAVFMPTKVRDLNIYNPRARQHFHPIGSSQLRLTQPPSILQLPPIPNTTLSVVNIFDISQNFKRAASATNASQTGNIDINRQSRDTSEVDDKIIIEERLHSSRMDKGQLRN